ncbi:methylated-DNA-protein-cysteine methyltransferase [Streptomyces himastatinicus ATCC 53653]|uniref:Methylated-DNA-protein-cysteine methyltransferase n=1 Tax=Streptomyces himastatinicus ATCC 53653 TaxID=457427 RepID=D9WL93_9ACTN|nr:methylated-DNA-protein-cysteine methyltransferase [Streptomyces himastatinicus ATCC 53653]
MRPFTTGDRRGPAITRTHFEIEYVTCGTDFRSREWQTLDHPVTGTTLSYCGIAELIGTPRTACRAVSTASGASPLLVVRPCHRVIGAGRALSGYAGGIDRKRQLLALESTAAGRLRRARRADRHGPWDRHPLRRDPLTGPLTRRRP